MPHLYINSFHPLAKTRGGRAAAERHGLPPFIDGSIRREPDFQHPNPVITCLCRAGRFAPRLDEGDHVVYLTVKEAGPQRLVAVLVVERLFPSHERAAEWFRERDMPLPVNLMVPGNPARPIDQSVRATIGGSDGAKSGGGQGEEAQRHRGCARSEHAAWNAEYLARAAKHPRVVGCSKLHCDPHASAPIVTDDDLSAVFGKVPSTQNPGRHDLRLLRPLLERVGVAVPPSCR